MQAGATYYGSKHFTPEQLANDQFHGILENQTRILTLIQPNTFKFTYHYFYEYQNTHYVVTDLVRNDTEFNGTYTKQAKNLVLTFNNGQQKAEEKYEKQKKKIGNHKNLAGKIVLLQEGNLLKVVELQILPKNYLRAEQIICKNLIFKKKT